jgi:hypothetical protein
MTAARMTATNVCFAAALLAALYLTGCSTTPRPATAKAFGPPAAATKDSTCLTTASRIPASAPNCQGTGRSYDGDDISRTGATNAGQALQQLDPAITSHP